MEYVQISKEEYEKLLRYRDIINNLEEDVHEQLNVKTVTDKKTIKVLEHLEQQKKEGKRKVISDEDFISKYKHLL